MIPTLLLLGLTALVGESRFGFGLLSKAPLGTVCRWTAERRHMVRPEVPFLQGAVKPHVPEGPWPPYEAACHPPVSFK